MQGTGGKTTAWKIQVLRQSLIFSKKPVPNPGPEVLPVLNISVSSDTHTSNQEGLAISGMVKQMCWEQEEGKQYNRTGEK